MYGAVAGDIIGSPYRYTDAQDRFFELAKGARGWSHGREVTFHPRVTSASVVMIGVVRWMIKDEQRHSSRLASILQETCLKYPESGHSPFMQRWMFSDNPRPSSRDESSACHMVIPVSMAAKTLPDAISFARQVAEVISTDQGCINAATALAQAVWMAGHGRSKEDIAFAMSNDFGLMTDMAEQDMRAMLSGAVKEPVVVNGMETGEFYYRETGRMSWDSQVILTAALQSFLKGEGFEDSVRRAVALGGASSNVASITGALCESFYRNVPEKIRGVCSTYIPADFRSRISSFEAICLNRTQKASTSPKMPDNSFNIIRMPDGAKIFSVPGYRTDIISALKDRFGTDITLMKPSDSQSMLRNLAADIRTGTYLEQSRPDVRTVYFQDGEFRTSATLKGEHLPPQEIRMASRQQFLEVADYAVAVKQQLQASVGYYGEGSIHFETAYYPVVMSDKVEVWKGDLFAGSLGIDPSSGLLKISQGGDFGPMEHFGTRTESVFSSVSIDAVKQSLGRYCLDEGIGIYDKNRTSNIETANRDISRSTDPKLLESVQEVSSSNIPRK